MNNVMFNGNQETPVLPINKIPTIPSEKKTKKTTKGGTRGYILQDSGLFACKRCGDTFFMKNDCLKHYYNFCKMRTKKVNNKKYIVDKIDKIECISCSGFFQTARELFLHMMFHEATRRILYNTQFIRNSETVFDVTDESTKIFICKFCDIKLEKSEFIPHVNCHLDESEIEHYGMFEANIIENRKKFFLAGVSASGNTYIMGRNNNGKTIAMSINSNGSTVFWRYKQSVEVMDASIKVECAGCLKKLDSARKLLLHVVDHDEPKELILSSVYSTKPAPIYISSLYKDPEDAIFLCKFCDIEMEKNEFFQHISTHFNASKLIQSNPREKNEDIPNEILWLGSNDVNVKFLLGKNTQRQAIVLALDFPFGRCTFWEVTANGDSYSSTIQRPQKETR